MEEKISHSFNHPISKATGNVDASLQSDEQTEHSSPVIIEIENCNSDVMSTQHSVASSARSDDSKGSQNDDNNIFEEVNSLSKEVCDMDKTKNDNTISSFNQPHEWVKRVVNKNCPINNSGRSEKFRLRISNMPVDWSPSEIQNFLFEEYCSVDVFYIATDKDLCFLGTVEVDFTSLDDCHAAYKKLNGKMVEDIKLFAEIKDSGVGAINEHSNEEAQPTAKKRKLNHTESWTPVTDVWEVDPKGLFGLKPEFLETLGIKPPIGKWVHVTNFRCEKSELKELLELAGQVIICSVDSRGPKYAKVMYSHPLEAVQAVSMFHNQDYYGLPLKVTIDSCLESGPILPKGLEALGPGLGIDQKPLQDIVKQYERFVNYKSSLVNTAIFLNPDDLFGTNVDETQSHATKQPNGVEDTAQSWYQTGVTQSTNQTPIENQGQTGYTPTGPIQSTFNQTPIENQGQTGYKPTGPIQSTFNQTPIENQGQTGYTPTGPIQSTFNQTPIENQGQTGYTPTGPIQSTFNQTPIENQGQTGYTSKGPIQSVSNFGPNVSGAGFCGPSPVRNAQQTIGFGPTGPSQMRTMPVPSMARQGPMAGQRPMAGPISGQGQNVMGPQGYMARAGMVRMNFRGSMAGPNLMGNLQRMVRPRTMGNPSLVTGFNVLQNAMTTARMMREPRQASDNATVTLSNLPLSTTFPMLCERMGQCGSVMSIQLTAPGCAVVQFAQRASAERCFQQYNNCNVLGNIITVALR